MKLLNKVKISLLISICIIMLFSIKAFAVTGIITEITVNLRERPSTDSKKIMYVTQDDVVEVLEKDGEWYKIKAKGKIGYVFGEYVKVYETKLEPKEETTPTVEQENVETNTENEEQEEIKEEQLENINTNLIIKSKTQVRLIPNISSSVIFTSSKDMQINIIEQMNKWTYISVGNVTGWVRTDKIVEENQVLPDKELTTSTTKKEENTDKENVTEEKEETKQETKIAYIKYDKVNLRAKASTTSTVLAKLKLNNQVTVLEESNKWSKVEVDGKTGYVSSDLLADEKQEIKEEVISTETNTTTSRDGETTVREENSTNKKEEVTNKANETLKEDNTSKKEENKETSSNKVTGEDVVAYAKKYLGYDYVYGGASPKSGFDCSGFTSYVYKHFGYTLSRSSKAQANNGTKVEKKDLQPGDLLIFKNQSLTSIGHVGIYVGNNKMIHSSEPGVGVVITDLDARGYNYNKRYVEARRIIK